MQKSVSCLMLKFMDLSKISKGELESKKSKSITYHREKKKQIIYVPDEGIAK